MSIIARQFCRFSNKKNTENKNLGNHPFERITINQKNHLLKMNKQTLTVDLSGNWQDIEVSAQEAREKLCAEIIETLEDKPESIFVIDLSKVPYSLEEFGTLLFDQFVESIEKKLPEITNLWDRITIEPITNPEVGNLVKEFKPDTKLSFAFA